MSDVFISLVAVQPTVPQIPKAGAPANIRGDLVPSPSAGPYSSVRQAGVKTK